MPSPLWKRTEDEHGYYSWRLEIASCSAQVDEWELGGGHYYKKEPGKPRMYMTDINHRIFLTEGLHSPEAAMAAAEAVLLRSAREILEHLG